MFHRLRASRGLRALRAPLLVAVAASPLAGFAPHAARPAVKPNVVTVTATNYAFAGPSSIPAGLTTLRLVNHGTELHHMWIVRLDSGKTYQDALAALKNPGPPPTWMHDVPGPNAARPGGESSSTLVLRPGTYVVMCLIPAADRMPHAMKGMTHELTVTPTYGAKAQALPPADRTITVHDYAFDFSKPMTAGTHVIRVRNTADQTHEVVLVRLDPGKTPLDVAKWGENPQGPPPATPVGGLTGITKDDEANFTVTFAPGEYGLICFVPDAKDGKPHFTHGMTKTFVVR